MKILPILGTKMQVQPITNQNNYKIRFKGTVSPEFVKYAETLRQDCLNAYPKQCFNRINNICDNIMNKAQRVMKNCFPQESVLLVDTTKSEYADTITYSNKVLGKYIPGDLILGDVHKRHKDPPSRRLLRLHRIIFDKGRFRDACIKDYAKVFALIYYTNYHDKNFVKDCIPVFEFYHDNINLLESEMKDDKYTRLITQAEYTELLSDLNKLSD